MFKQKINNRQIDLYKNAVQVIEMMLLKQTKSGFLMTKLKYNEVQMISTERLCTTARHTKKQCTNVLCNAFGGGAEARNFTFNLAGLVESSL